MTVVAFKRSEEKEALKITYTFQRKTVVKEWEFMIREYRRERERERERERLTCVDPHRGNHLKRRYSTSLFAQMNLNGFLFHIVWNKIFLQHYAYSYWW